MSFPFLAAISAERRPVITATLLPVSPDTYPLAVSLSHSPSTTYLYSYNPGSNVIVHVYALPFHVIGVALVLHPFMEPAR